MLMKGDGTCMGDTMDLEPEYRLPFWFCRIINRQALCSQSSYTMKHYWPSDHDFLIFKSNQHIPFKFISILPNLYFMKQLYRQQWDFMVARSLFEVRYIVLGFSSGLYAVVGSSVKHLEINCRDWLND